MTLPSLPYKLLIVEDDLLWSEPMADSLEDVFKLDNDRSSQCIVNYSRDAADTKEKLSHNHYHLLSLDQNLPANKVGSETSIRVGSELTKSIRKKYPCSGIAVYTQYQRNEIGQRAGHDALILIKNVDGIEGDSPDAWANKLLEWLEDHYFPYYFKQSSRYSPPHLATMATYLHRSLEQSPCDWQGYVGRSIHFWALTLRLAQAQAQALCRYYGCNADIATQDTFSAMEKTLETMVCRLQTHHSIEPWNAYIGNGGANTRGGDRFLRDGSQAFRKLRNDLVHTHSLKPWKEVARSMKHSLFHIMDAAAFWSSFPMVTNIKQQNYGYIGDFLRGSGYPWPRGPLTLPPDTELLNDSEHVYLLWRDPSQSDRLIDLWPFLHLEFDQELNRQVLWVISHRRKQHWFRCSLQTGKIQEWQPGNSVIDALKAATAAQ